MRLFFTNNRENLNKVQQDVKALSVPTTASSVPWLTSLHTRPGRGNYGASSFPGNCSGLLIHDLLSFYRPQSVLDPMTGSGTCRDVCKDLGIRCVSFDLEDGHDAADPKSLPATGEFDFVWLHPPYWNLIRYSRDLRCLSQASTVDEFIRPKVGACKLQTGARRPRQSGIAHGRYETPGSLSWPTVPSFQCRRGGRALAGCPRNHPREPWSFILSKGLHPRFYPTAA